VEYPRLVAAVALVTASLPAAEDAVQEGLLRAWERSERGEQIESLASWVVTVALNISRSGLRRIVAERKARRRLAPTTPVRAEPATADRVDVERAVAALPRRQREVVVLRYFLDMNTREVAQTLHVGEGTVKSSLSRARTALANALSVQDLETADDDA
jgi:RNA polymerase sigma-70 factor (ECF subfamily)